MSTYLRDFNVHATPQTQAIPFTLQTPNHAGGYGWEVDDWTRLRRFLVLGSENGTYYVDERKLTAENTRVVLRCIATDGMRAMNEIVQISASGRAPKNDPALFALALAASKGDDAIKRIAFGNLRSVARTGTHLLHFVQFITQFRGWGRGLRRAVGEWFTNQDPGRLAYELIKYQQRDGWAMRDLLRLAHPTPHTDQHRALFHWVTKGWGWVGDQPHPDEALRQVWAMEHLKRLTPATEAAAADLVSQYRLPREAVPSERLSDPLVWEALLNDMPVGAWIRNLATLTRVGLLTALGNQHWNDRTVAMLEDTQRLQRGRIHPIQVLAALRTYAQGRSMRGSTTWTPVPRVVAALDQAFYRTFSVHEPSNMRLHLSVDVSGSMASTQTNGMPFLPAREACAAMVAIMVGTETNLFVSAFDTSLYQMPFTQGQRLDDIARHLGATGGGGTDCALPILWATQEQQPVDCFVILTDSETWQGRVHPAQALAAYRKATGIQAKLAVCALAATGVTIADPQDGLQINLVGLDTAAPQIIADFAAGKV